MVGLAAFAPGDFASRFAINRQKTLQNRLLSGSGGAGISPLDATLPAAERVPALGRRSESRRQTAKRPLVAPKVHPSTKKIRCGKRAIRAKRLIEHRTEKLLAVS